MKNLSKLMALILRHEPERFGVSLDPEGFVAIDDLVAAIAPSWPSVTREHIVAVVGQNEPKKQRYTIVGDDIRANYGHSVALRIAHDVVHPPVELFHGTHAGAVTAILAEGLRPMGRQYVHLTNDRELARRVGRRRGEPVVLRVDTASAVANGIVFRRANQAFWLVDAMPAACLTIE
ncbi:MAG: RNA 2'-phosphotransferase [Planctomycetota bacterium]